MQIWRSRIEEDIKKPSQFHRINNYRFFFICVLQEEDVSEKENLKKTEKREMMLKQVSILRNKIILAEITAIQQIVEYLKYCDNQNISYGNIVVMAAIHFTSRNSYL